MDRVYIDDCEPTWSAIAGIDSTRLFHIFANGLIMFKSSLQYCIYLSGIDTDSGQSLLFLHVDTEVDDRASCVIEIYLMVVIIS